MCGVPSSLVSCIVTWSPRFTEIKEPGSDSLPGVKDQPVGVMNLPYSWMVTPAAATLGVRYTRRPNMRVAVSAYASATRNRPPLSGSRGPTPFVPSGLLRWGLRPPAPHAHPHQHRRERHNNDDEHDQAPIEDGCADSRLRRRAHRDIHRRRVFGRKLRVVVVVQFHLERVGPCAQPSERPARARGLSLEHLLTSDDLEHVD